MALFRIFNAIAETPVQSTTQIHRLIERYLHESLEFELEWSRTFLDRF